jgi:hypothetical protein
VLMRERRPCRERLFFRKPLHSPCNANIEIWGEGFAAELFNQHTRAAFISQTPVF